MIPKTDTTGHTLLGPAHKLSIWELHLIQEIRGSGPGSHCVALGSPDHGGDQAPRERAVLTSSSWPASATWHRAALGWRWRIQHPGQGTAQSLCSCPPPFPAPSSAFARLEAPVLRSHSQFHVLPGGFCQQVLLPPRPPPASPAAPSSVIKCLAHSSGRSPSWKGREAGAAVAVRARV